MPEDSCDEAIITSAIEKLEQVLKKEGISYHVPCGGHKSLYSIYCKMLKQVLFLPFTVMDGGTVQLEVQLRAQEMHLQAEFGFAAHWRYKDGDCKYSLFVLQMVEWARWVVTWHCETTRKDRSSICFSDSIKRPCKFPSHSEEFLASYKPNSSQDGPVYVTVIENDKMSLQEFLASSTVLDLLRRAGP